MAAKDVTKKKKRRWTRDDTELTVLALPTTIWYFLFAFMPMFGIIIAFKDYKIKGGFLQSIIQSDWIGFQNFKFLFPQETSGLSFETQFCIISRLSYSILLFP